VISFEKDFPNGVEPSLSAEQIDYVPDEFENRLPDFCVNGNKAWLVDPFWTSRDGQPNPKVKGL
jgi:hypothetical protein